MSKRRRHDLSACFDKHFVGMTYKVPGDDLDEMVFLSKRGLSLCGDWRYPFPNVFKPWTLSAAQREAIDKLLVSSQPVYTHPSRAI